jgi:hypothetical protein
MTDFYLSNCGWPIEATEYTSWNYTYRKVRIGNRICGDFRLGDTSSPLAPRDKTLVDPAEHPNPLAFEEAFYEKWGGKSMFIRGADFIDKLGIYTSKHPFRSMRLHLVDYWTSGGYVLGPTSLYPVCGGYTETPYEELYTEEAATGIADFTYGDAVSPFNVPMVDFFQTYVSQKYWWHIQLFQPRVSSKFQGKISLYASKKDKDRDRLTALRPGRAFKLMFPALNDKDVALLVDNFNKKFPVVNLTLHTGEDEESFIKAYSYEQSVMQNVCTTAARKSLANSCMRMRPEHEGLPKHPSAAYASGDFLSVWTEDEDGRIASRCVVYLNEGGKPQAGPVYGTSEIAIDMIEAHLATMDSVLYDQSSWVKARLLYIPCNGGALAPYLDLERCLTITGDYLTISNGDEGDGDFYADNYSGVLQGGSPCYECSENLSPDETYTSEDGNCYCSSCYNDIFAHCHESGNEYRIEDMETVRTAKYRWGYQEELVYNPEDYDYVMVDGYWYASFLTVETEQGTVHLEGDEGYFTCEQTGELHDLSEQKEARIDGTLYTVSNTWVEDNDYVIGSDLVYEPKEDDEKEAA